MTIDLRDLGQEIEHGLANERERLDNARENYAYYKGDFDPYRWRLPNNRQDDSRSYRSSMVMNKIVNTLTNNLYKTDPHRTIKKHDQATQWLQQVYKQNGMFAKWLMADRFATVNQVAAFQVAGGDDQKPVKISLWDAHNFTVWEDPDDPCDVVAVCTIDFYDNRRRYTLWTNETTSVFESEKVKPGQTTGGTLPRLVSQQENPYGVIPFAFASYNYQTTEFWAGGPGDSLRELNDFFNFQLTKSADAIRYLVDPFLVATGTDERWEPPKPLLPGDVLNLPGGQIDEGGNFTTPTLEFRQANPQFVTATWQDMQNYLNHTLEVNGIPESAIRMVQSVARSGVSIIMENLPLIQWAKTRQPQFAHYENNLAKVVLQVATAHYRNNGKSVPADLESALNDFDLTIKWGDQYPEIPGPERDREDLFNLQLGLTDPVAILMKRAGLTEDEAVEQIREVQRRNKIYAQITGAPPVLPTTAPPTGDGMAGETPEPETDTEETNEQGEEG